MTSLHQLIDAALERGARAHDYSRGLIEDNARVSRAVRDTLDAIHERRRRAEDPKRSETDRYRV
jgi:hypothetical protein